MNLTISAWSGMFLDKTPEEAVKLFMKSGLNAFELSAPTGEKLFARTESASAEKVGKDFRKYLDTNGFKVTQGHLPFIGIDLSAEKNEESVEILKRRIELYQSVGVKDMVLHIGNLPNPSPKEKLLSRRVKAVKELLAQVNKGNSICLENLVYVVQSGTELKELVEEIGSENVGVCFDTGHLNLGKNLFRIYESAETFFRHVGKYIRALHINDNDGKSDEHMIPNVVYHNREGEPLEKNINLFEITELLNRYGYDGEYNFECPGENRAPDDIREEKLRLIKKVGEFYLSCV